MFPIHSRALGVLLGCAMLLPAQPGVWLKTLNKPEQGTGATGRASALSLKRRTAGRWHFLLVFRQVPDSTMRQILEARGIRPLDFVPERGLIASVPDGTFLEDLDLEWSGRIEPQQKISPFLISSGLLSGALAPSGREEWNLLAEFHRDVDRADAVGLVFEEGLTIVDNPDLAPTQLLVRGPAERLAGLALWDEVSYLFPASQELKDGRRVEACSGAITASGPIGQIVAKVGEGWDGPGRGAVELGYIFSSFPRRLPAAQVQAEFQRALNEWSRQVQVRFRPATSTKDPKTIHVLAGSGEHGDGYPFEGRGGTLAHTFYPSPPNPEPLAGDLHLDDDEPWSVGEHLDLFSVMLHELGHALGLGHSDNPNSVMYPYYRKVSGLAEEDIRAIQELYAKQDQPGSSASVPGPAPAAPLEIHLTQPNQLTWVTRETQISVMGTTSGGNPIGQVAWTSSHGPSGLAQGWRNWSIAAIPIPVGETTVTITAIDGAQSRAWTQLRIVRQPPPTPPLSIRILTPTTQSSMISSTNSVILTGEAGPPSAVSRIFWSNSRGSGGSMAGSASWSTPPLQLETGVNRITVTAATSDGVTASASLEIDYRPGATPPVGSDTVAPALTILEPSLNIFTTASPTLTITGTATDNIGVIQVNWLTSSGRTGVAQGTTHWRIPDLPLQAGINTIVIRAWDAAGNMSWRSLVVTRN